MARTPPDQRWAQVRIKSQVLIHEFESSPNLLVASPSPWPRVRVKSANKCQRGSVLPPVAKSENTFLLTKEMQNRATINFFKMPHFLLFMIYIVTAVLVLLFFFYLFNFDHIAVPLKLKMNTRGPHQPRPVDDPVQPQSDEDELENIHRTEHLQLRKRKRVVTFFLPCKTIQHVEKTRLTSRERSCLKPQTHAATETGDTKNSGMNTSSQK